MIPTTKPCSPLRSPQSLHPLSPPTTETQPRNTMGVASPSMLSLPFPPSISILQKPHSSSRPRNRSVAIAAAASDPDGSDPSPSPPSPSRRGLPRFRWRDLLEPDAENIAAVGLTGLLAWASAQALAQIFFISAAIVLAALKYSFIAALLLLIVITLL